MNTSFERTITVQKHANYGAFLADDRKFYKPDGKKLTLEDFQVGQTYNIKGYSSETGKTNYITMLLTQSKQDSTHPAPVAPAPAAPRRLSLPKVEATPEPAGDDKGLTLSGGRRDFKKEAKGKTLSLFIAALLQNGGVPVDMVVKVAESVVSEMDEKGYF